MRWIIFVLVMVVAILIVACYALMVVAHDADERAEKMYIALKENEPKIPTIPKRVNKTYRSVWLDENYDEIGASNDE